MKYPTFLLLFAFLLNACNSSDSTAEANARPKPQKVNQTETLNDDALPYRQIPDYPEDYSSGNVIARMIDGLGYRFYWTTEGLTEENMKYQPSESGRTIFETLEHVYDLSETVVNAAQNLPNIRPTNHGELTFEKMRSGTLNNLKKASDLFLGKTEAEVSELKVMFQRGEKTSEYPFWHMLNGPIADAMWHTGQIVMMRRSAGNPLPKGVNVFMGKTKEQ